MTSLWHRTRQTHCHHSLWRSTHPHLLLQSLTEIKTPVLLTWVGPFGHWDGHPLAEFFLILSIIEFFGYFFYVIFLFFYFVYYLFSIFSVVTRMSPFLEVGRWSRVCGHLLPVVTWPFLVRESHVVESQKRSSLDYDMSTCPARRHLRHLHGGLTELGFQRLEGLLALSCLFECLVFLCEFVQGLGQFCKVANELLIEVPKS